MISRLRNAGWPSGPSLDSVPPNITRGPSLDDLLDDPIMLLLWRSDKLEPSEARATIRKLLRSAQSSGSAQSGLIQVMQRRCRLKAGLAA